MKCVIYGVNRVAKDFLYIFDNLDIEYIIEDRSDVVEFMGYKVNSLEYALNNRNYDKIVLCDFDKTEKIKCLQEHGLGYKEDYVYEEDFFTQLDDFSIPKDKKLAIWGTGTIAKEFYSYSVNMNVACYIDTYKNKERFFDIPVVKPDDIENWEDFFVIIAVVKDEEIRNVLGKKGFIEKENFVGYQTVTGRPSELLRKTIFDKAYYDFECNTMLNHLEVFYRGNTRCCCTTFVEQNLDNIFDKNVDDLWHSNLHKVIALSTVNRTYSFCNKTMCPLFVSHRSENTVLDNNKYNNITFKPEVIAVGYDATCNLCCKTCRKDIHVAKGCEYEQIKKITDKLKTDYLKACKFLIIAGDGEVFLSPNYRSIYEDVDCNPDYIRILTNGTLFTPDRWENFHKNKTGKIMMTVSIDAATKETYEKIRCRGDFEQLKKNMTFASELRKKGELRYLRMNFVVQKLNYKEMIPFVKWGNELGVDEIFFTKILNWGTYTDEEFAEVSMMEADGVTPKKELKEILDNPLIKQSSIVDLGTIQYSHKSDKVEKVENYYMWELEKRGGKIFD